MGDHLPHPTDCSMYQQCDYDGSGSTKLVDKPCPAGLHWSVAGTTCDFPVAAGCESNSSSEQNQKPKPFTPRPLPAETEPSPPEQDNSESGDSSSDNEYDV